MKKKWLVSIVLALIAGCGLAFEVSISVPEKVELGQQVIITVEPMSSNEVTSIEVSVENKATGEIVEITDTEKKGDTYECQYLAQEKGKYLVSTLVRDVMLGSGVGEAEFEVIEKETTTTTAEEVTTTTSEPIETTTTIKVSSTTTLKPDETTTSTVKVIPTTTTAPIETTTTTADVITTTTSLEITPSSTTSIEITTSTTTSIQEYDTDMYLDPDEVSVAPLAQFNLILMADTEEPVFGVEFVLNFDPQLIEYIEMSEGDFLKTDCSTIAADNLVSEGRVKYLSVRMGSECSGVTGQGEVVSLTFRALGELGTSQFVFSDVKIYLYDEDTDEMVERNWAPAQVSLE